LVGISIDVIDLASLRVNASIVVDTEGAVTIVTVDSSGTERILLESGENNFIRGHLIPKTEILWNIQSWDSIRVDTTSHSGVPSSRTNTTANKEGDQEDGESEFHFPVKKMTIIEKDL
jgi:hypothetical protein